MRAPFVLVALLALLAISSALSASGDTRTGSEAAHVLLTGSR